MELSDIQASNGLKRRFFKGVGNSGREEEEEERGRRHRRLVGERGASERRLAGGLRLPGVEQVPL